MDTAAVMATVTIMVTAKGEGAGRVAGAADPGAAAAGMSGVGVILSIARSGTCLVARV